MDDPVARELRRARAKFSQYVSGRGSDVRDMDYISTASAVFHLFFAKPTVSTPDLRSRFIENIEAFESDRRGDMDSVYTIAADVIRHYAENGFVSPTDACAFSSPVSESIKLMSVGAVMRVLSSNPSVVESRNFTISTVYSMISSSEPSLLQFTAGFVGYVLSNAKGAEYLPVVDGITDALIILRDKPEVSEPLKAELESKLSQRVYKRLMRRLNQGRVKGELLPFEQKEIPEAATPSKVDGSSPKVVSEPHPAPAESTVLPTPPTSPTSPTPPTESTSPTTSKSSLDSLPVGACADAEAPSSSVASAIIPLLSGGKDDELDQAVALLCSSDSEVVVREVATSPFLTTKDIGRLLFAVLDTSFENKGDVVSQLMAVCD